MRYGRTLAKLAKAASGCYTEPMATPCTIAPMTDEPPRADDYGPREIARLIGVSEDTVRRMIDDGEFGEVDVDWYWTRRKKHKGHRRVSMDAVHRYLRDTGLSGKEDS